VTRANSFRAALGLLKERFFLPEEFPLADRSANARKAAGRVLSWSKKSWESHASALTARELEDLLYSLILGAEPRVMRLLALRFSARLAGLLWALFQHHPDCAALSQLIAEACPEPGRIRESGGRLMLLEGFRGDPAETAARAMLSECGSAGGFIRRHGLIKDSPFYMRVLEKFFSRCGATVLADNFGPLNDYVRALETPAGNPAVEHYLLTVEPRYYHVNLNLYIIERLGMPLAAPANWEAFSPLAGSRIGDWYKLHLLDGLLKKPGRKYDVLTSRLREIRELRYSEEDGALRLDFGAFSIYDPNPKSEEAILFMKPSVGMTITHEDFMALDRLPEAKDYVLEDEQADAYRLVFFEFGKLYAAEMIDICLGLSMHYQRNVQDSKRKRGIVF